MSRESQKQRYWSRTQIFEFLKGSLVDLDRGYNVTLLNDKKGKLLFVISDRKGRLLDVREIITMKDLYEADYELKRDFGLGSYITGICSINGFDFRQHEHLRESIIFRIFNEYE